MVRLVFFKKQAISLTERKKEKERRRYFCVERLIVLCFQHLCFRSFMSPVWYVCVFIRVGTFSLGQTG
jgi:hypothetical protein